MKKTRKKKDWFSVTHMEKTHDICWADLVALEPQLEILLRQARAVGDACRNYSEQERGWTQFKQPIFDLVGYFGKHKGHPLLGTNGAYEVTYWRLHNALVGDEPQGE